MIILENTAFRVVFAQRVESPCKQITSVAFLVLCVLGGRRPADAISVAAGHCCLSVIVFLMARTMISLDFWKMRSTTDNWPRSRCYGLVF